MKNITVSVEDTIYRQARIKAAERDTSVSALVRAYLVGLANGTEAGAGFGSEFDGLAARERELRRRLFAAGKGLRSADNLPRETLHDRKANALR